MRVWFRTVVVGRPNQQLEQSAPPAVHASTTLVGVHHAQQVAPTRPRAPPPATEQQQPGGGGGRQPEEEEDDGNFRFLGLTVSKDDVATITIALVISYGIRW